MTHSIRGFGVCFSRGDENLPPCISHLDSSSRESRESTIELQWIFFRISYFGIPPPTPHFSYVHWYPHAGILPSLLHAESAA